MSGFVTTMIKRTKWWFYESWIWRMFFYFHFLFYVWNTRTLFFFRFRSSFCLLSKKWPLWVSLFCNEGAIHTNNWLLYWRKTTTTKPNEIELIKNPEQITNDLNNNMADLCDIIFKKWSKKLLVTVKRTELWC